MNNLRNSVDINHLVTQNNEENVIVEQDAEGLEDIVQLDTNVRHASESRNYQRPPEEEQDTQMNTIQIVPMLQGENHADTQLNSPHRPGDQPTMTMYPR